MLCHIFFLIFFLQVVFTLGSSESVNFSSGAENVYAAAWMYSDLWKKMYIALVNGNSSVPHLLLGSQPAFLGTKSLPLKTPPVDTLNNVASAVMRAALRSDIVSMGLSFSSLAYCATISIFLYMEVQNFPVVKPNLKEARDLIDQGMKLINKTVQATSLEALDWLKKVKFFEDDIRWDIEELESYKSRIAFWKPYTFGGLLGSGVAFLCGAGSMLVVGPKNPLIIFTVGSALGFGLSIYQEKTINSTLADAIKVLNRLKNQLESVQETKTSLSSTWKTRKTAEENGLLIKQNKNLEQQVTELMALLKDIIEHIPKNNLNENALAMP